MSIVRQQRCLSFAAGSALTVAIYVALQVRHPSPPLLIDIVTACLLAVIVLLHLCGTTTKPIKLYWNAEGSMALHCRGPSRNSRASTSQSHQRGITDELTSSALPSPTAALCGPTNTNNAMGISRTVCNFDRYLIPCSGLNSEDMWLDNGMG